MVANHEHMLLTTTATAWSQVRRAGRTPCVRAGHATAILGEGWARASEASRQALGAAQTLNVPTAIAAGCRQGRTTWSAALMVANHEHMLLTTTATAWSQVRRAGRTPCVRAGHATAILGEGEAIVPEDRFVGGFGHTDSPIPAPLLSFSRPLRQKLRECPKSTAFCCSSAAGAHCPDAPLARSPSGGVGALL